MKMKDRAKADRPREKLAIKGAASLSDLELLMALIGSGNKQADVGKIAKDTLKLIQAHGADISYEQLQQVTGMGSAKITEILAALELSKRYLIDSEQPIIDSPEKAAEQLADIRDKKQEYFVCLTLDGANRLIAKRTITIGTLTSSLVHPREVFADAIADRAASIIIAHNHPSGSVKPSTADVEVTNRLTKAAQLVGISLVDHIVVTKTSFASIL
ncbi:MAG TPA: DNA repair protein RadC [Candidatus Saccharibacteria bacterium]|nr:DNA repair protein RadC [Candidatus Saccharibacteria bacterium]